MMKQARFVFFSLIALLLLFEGNIHAQTADKKKVLELAEKNQVIVIGETHYNRYINAKIIEIITDLAEKYQNTQIILTAEFINQSEQNIIDGIMSKKAISKEDILKLSLGEQKNIQNVISAIWTINLSRTDKNKIKIVGLELTQGKSNEKRNIDWVRVIKTKIEEDPTAKILSWCGCQHSRMDLGYSVGNLLNKENISTGTIQVYDPCDKPYPADIAILEEESLTIDASTTLKDAFEELAQNTLSTALLTGALTKANEEMDKTTPDVATCTQIMDLGTIIIAKLGEKADVTSVLDKFTTLADKMSAYTKALDSKTATLDKILEKKTLGKNEFIKPEQNNQTTTSSELGMITVTGESHYVTTAENKIDELRELAKKNEAFVLREGVRPTTSGNYKWFYPLENDYVYALTTMLTMDLAFFGKEISIKLAGDKEINTTYRCLLALYDNSPYFQKAFSKIIFPTDESSEAFLKKFKDDALSLAEDKKQENFDRSYLTVSSALALQPNIKYLINSILKELVKDPTYENNYIKELPDITPPLDYKEDINEYLTDPNDVVTSKLVESIMIDWRNRIFFHLIKGFVQEHTDATKPIYIMVGKAHLDETVEFLKLNFSDLFKIKSIFIASDPSLQKAFDSNIELENTAKEIMKKGLSGYNALSQDDIPELLIRYKKYLQDNNRIDEAKTVKRFLLSNLNLQMSPAQVTEANKSIEAIKSPATIITEQSSLQDIYAELQKPSTNEGYYLALITIALKDAEIEAGKATPDYKMCSKIYDLCNVLLQKAASSVLSSPLLIKTLQENASELNDLKTKIDAGSSGTFSASLDKILEKKSLGETEFEELFGTNGVATSTINEYNKDPEDPFNAINVLVVEKFIRRFESASNAKGVSETLYSKITTSDFFKTDSDTYTAWKAAIDKIKVDDLKAGTKEENEKLEKYKTELKSIDTFEVK